MPTPRAPAVLAGRTSVLPAVPAPLQPTTGLCFEVGPRAAPLRWSVCAVSGRSFTVAHAGQRTRLPLLDWHSWLQTLLAQGPVHLAGHPMQPPLPAPMTILRKSRHERVQHLPETACNEEGDEMEQNARRARVQRAQGQVLAKYQLQRLEASEARWVYALQGGSQPWHVTVQLPAGPTTCDCPDYRDRGGGDPRYACKHILAVLMNEPELRHLALDFFL